MSSRPPVVLSIAGSDPSGGAGIQADLKTFSALGAYGTCVITALTAQNTRGVTGVHGVPAAFVRQQLETLADDVRIDAVKIGMLGGADVVREVGAFLTERAFPVVVLDPVMVATSGDRLLAADAVAALRELLPLASIITPNLPEAGDLLGTGAATDVDGMLAQAEQLLALGPQRVLLKGGHLVGSGAEQASSDAAEAVDVLACDHGGRHVLRSPRVDTTSTHGTGCSLSSAIAALVPQRDSWGTAVREAKQWLTDALAAADELRIQRDPAAGGHGPVHHFHAVWPR
ncbi:MAG: bifunctional hydroxymethylpyrimidine kinase/phosphomethylpyrimidine kinase [Kineosporiaceae bacterium]